MQSRAYSTLRNSGHVIAPRAETPVYTSADFDNPADTIIKVLLRNEKFTRDCRMQIWGSPISGRDGCGHIRALPTMPVYRRRIEMPAPSVSAIAETTAARLSRSFAGRERMLRRAGMRRITLVRYDMPLVNQYLIDAIRLGRESRQVRTESKKLLEKY